MTIAIISRPFLRIGQNLVGFVQFLELNFSFRIAGIAVGMTLHRRLAESGFHLDVRAALGNAQNFVVAPPGHRALRSNHPRSAEPSAVGLPRRLALNQNSSVLIANAVPITIVAAVTAP